MALQVNQYTTRSMFVFGLSILICIGVLKTYMGSGSSPSAQLIKGDETTLTLSGEGLVQQGDDHGLRGPRAMPPNSSAEHQNIPNSLETLPLEARDKEWERNHRLIDEVFPVHYDLYLNPDFSNALFTGRVSISLDVNTTVDHLRLHVKDLDVTNSSLSTSSGEHVPIQETFIYEPNEFLVLRMSTPLIPGKYKLTMVFNGSLKRGIVGLYRSEYFDPLTNQTQYVVSSKFQPTYARRAFPCFDEPGFKSTFSISVVKPSYLTALSNMPAETEQPDQPSDGLTTVHFQKSVPMVTYLVAIAIGDFDYNSAKSERGVPIRIFSTKFQREKTRYAVSVVPKMVDFYEKYFGIDYPLPKLDVIGIPDFVSGAMEHWGLISFREANLFFDPSSSTAANKQRVALVLSHEIAHMWFGNLMTLKWWSDLWLNEGFASYCEYKAVNHVHPEWEVEAQFVSLDLTPVLVLDAKQSSHPIVQEVAHPDQITEIFDSISYNKGASVIRMLEYFIGPTKFQNGVSKFLKTFSYKNAETKDLWATLQSEVGHEMNVSFLMETWTRQMGYPVLVVTETEDGNLTITQERYLTNPEQLKNTTTRSKLDYKWEIPLRLTTNETKTSTSMVMHQTEDKVIIPAGSSGNWTNLNPDYFGYFRVQYSTEVWKQIKNVFVEDFSPAERCGLVDDIFSFAYSRRVSYDLALEFGDALKQDGHLVPWDCAITHLRLVSSLLRSSSPDTYASFRKYITNLTSTVYERFVWSENSSETHLDALLKTRIFNLACSHGHEGCLANAKRLFHDWIQNDVPVAPSLRPLVYVWGVWQGDSDDWKQTWNRYVKESDAQERVRLLGALAASQDPETLRRFIALAWNETLVRRQDYFTAMNYIARNPKGNPILWKYYTDEYDNLVKRFTVNDRYFGKMILPITSFYSSQHQLQQIIQFLDKHPVAGAGKRARQTALETVQANIEWEQRNVLTIKHWLLSNKY